MIEQTRLLKKQIMEKYGKMGVAIEGVLELTARCNLNCKMCYIHTNPNESYLMQEKGTDWWLALIDEAYHSGMMFTRLTGGECLLHPGFQVIYNHLKELGIRISINTNGVLLNEKYIEFFLKNPPDEIQVTLYGSDDGAYNAVTGHQCFEVVWNNILRVRDSGLPLIVAITPSIHASQDVARIIAKVKAAGIPYNVNAHLFSAYNKDERDTNESNFNDVDEEILFLKTFLPIQYPKTAIDSLPETCGSCKVTKRGMRCPAGTSTFWVTWNGYMQPCSALHDLKYYITDFSTALRLMQDAASQYLQPVECISCRYKKVCVQCPEARRSGAEEGHCNPYICMLTKRKVSEGLAKLPKEK